MAQTVDSDVPIEVALREINTIGTDGKEIDKYFDILESYECWDPLFTKIKEKVASQTHRNEKDYLRLARIHAKYFEDLRETARICRDLVELYRISYQDFREQVLPPLVEDEDFAAEAIILESVRPVLRSLEEKILCIERLCLIYEKKKYDEAALSRSYSLLIDLDKHNQKALKYFKATFVQNQSWDEVVDVLFKLYQSAKHVNDGYRIAQELATVYLFQLDRPQDAIEVIRKYCRNSPLDTSSILYEAYYRVKDWKGCLEVLLDYLPKVQGDTDKAIVYLKIGELQELIGKVDDALESFSLSSRYDPSILDPLENSIEIHIYNQNWPQVVVCLRRMEEILHDVEMKTRVSEALERIQSGLAAR